MIHVGLEKVADNILVPKHEIVPEEKIQEVLEKFGSTLERFPQISKADPAVEEIGGKKGDLIKITRNSHTGGKSVYFRVVL